MAYLGLIVMKIDVDATIKDNGFCINAKYAELLDKFVVT